MSESTNLSQSIRPLTEERQPIPTSARDDIDQDEYDEIWEEIEEVEEEEEIDECQELDRSDWKQKLTTKWSDILKAHNLTPEKQKKINDHFTDFFPGGIIEDTLQSILNTKKIKYYEDELSTFDSRMEKRLKNIISLYEFSEACKELCTSLLTNSYIANISLNDLDGNIKLLQLQISFLMRFVDGRLNAHFISSMTQGIKEILPLRAEIVKMKKKISLEEDKFFQLTPKRQEELKDLHEELQRNRKEELEALRNAYLKAVQKTGEVASDIIEKFEQPTVRAIGPLLLFFDDKLASMYKAISGDGYFDIHNVMKKMLSYFIEGESTSRKSPAEVALDDYMKEIAEQHRIDRLDEQLKWKAERANGSRKDPGQRFAADIAKQNEREESRETLRREMVSQPRGNPRHFDPTIGYRLREMVSQPRGNPSVASTLLRTHLGDSAIWNEIRGTARSAAIDMTRD